MRCALILIILIVSLKSVSADVETEVELPPVIKEGTAGEILYEDPILPALDARIQLKSGSGSIQNSLENQLALPVTDYGGVGGAAQIRGLGPSAEDVDVQVFGISLNPPQGGGFDLTTFPQFLWAGFQYRSGPSLNALNQTSASGTLALTPWTVKALKTGSSTLSGSEFYSDQGINQVSANMTDGKNIAVVGGYTSLRKVGPSGALSAQWEKGTSYSGHFHALASNLDMESNGSTLMPTPNARMRSSRIIPVLQNDFRLSPMTFLKTSLFLDWNSIVYNNPNINSADSSYTHQWGGQAVYLMGDWKYGLSYRQQSYSSFGSFPVSAPLQRIGNIQISRTQEIGRAGLLDSTFQGVWVSGLGLLPQGSVGGRKEWNHGHQAVFSRLSFSQRLPSLLDRYAVFGAEFMGNPSLISEQDWTGTFGGEVQGIEGEASLQVYSQLRQNARVSLERTVTNLGNGSVLAVQGSGRAHFYSWLDFYEVFTFSKSFLDASGLQFPYVPSWADVAGMSVHSTQGTALLELSASVRLSSSRTYAVSSPDLLPSYGVMDLGIKFTLVDKFSLAGRVENLFDREIELVKGYPLGRSFSIWFSAEN